MAESKYYAVVLVIMLIASVFAYITYFDGEIPLPNGNSNGNGNGNGNGPPPPVSGVLSEILEPALTDWENWKSYPNGQAPRYDEYKHTFTTYSYPDGLYCVYLYLLTGERAHLDFAVFTLKFTANNLVNENGVWVLYDRNMQSASSTPISASEAYGNIIAISYIVQLQLVSSYAKKLGNAVLKFQSSSTGLFAGAIDAYGNIVHAAECFGERSLGCALLRLYEVTHDSLYLNAALKLVDGLWSLRGSGNLIKDGYNSQTGAITQSTTRCHGQWGFTTLAKHAYMKSGNSKYYDMYHATLQAMYNTFWFGDHWNYRTGYDLWEMYQPMVASDLLGMGEFINQDLTDIKKRIIQKLEFSSLNLLIHAVTDNGSPQYNTNDNIPCQMASVLAAWAYDYLGSGTEGYETALELYQALVRYHKKSRGFISGVDALTGNFYHKWGNDFSNLKNGISISWSAAPLILRVEGNIKLDFGHGFNTPFRLGSAYDVPLIDIDKFRINIAEGYVKVRVQSGSGQITLQTDSNIQSVLKNGGSYTNFSGATLTVDGSGTFEIHF